MCAPSEGGCQMNPLRSIRLLPPRGASKALVDKNSGVCPGSAYYVLDTLPPLLL